MGVWHKNASYMAKLDEYRMKHPKVILDPYEQRQSDRKTAHEALQKELERFATTRSVAE